VPRDSGEPEITQDMIARRAFELWLTNGSLSPEQNWARAEQELREEATLHKQSAE
jgi:hypothetical protein